jgi:hypothetical protein
MANGQTFTSLVDLSLSGYDHRWIFISRHPWTCNGYRGEKMRKIPLENCAIRFAVRKRREKLFGFWAQSRRLLYANSRYLSGLSVHYV